MTEAFEEQCVAHYIRPDAERRAMKVSDRQWSVGDVLRVKTPGHVREEQAGAVVSFGLMTSDYPVRIEFPDGERYWMHNNDDVELVLLQVITGTSEKPNQGGTMPTIEQRAVRLAEVYRRANDAADVELRKADSSEHSDKVAHEIAMLLVKRELE